METPEQQSRALDLPPGSRGRGGGRKSSDGIPETVKVPTLKSECPRLKRLLKKALDLMEQYKADLNAVCEKTGANSPVVHRLLKASIKGNFEAVRQRAEQESIIFQGVGEVPDHPE